MGPVGHIIEVVSASGPTGITDTDETIIPGTDIVMIRCRIVSVRRSSKILKSRRDVSILGRLAVRKDNDIALTAIHVLRRGYPRRLKIIWILGAGNGVVRARFVVDRRKLRKIPSGLVEGFSQWGPARGYGVVDLGQHAEIIPHVDNDPTAFRKIVLHQAEPCPAPGHLDDPRGLSAKCHTHLKLRCTTAS